MSTNTSSQETFTIGTFQDISIGKILLGGKVIVIPYDSINNTELFFSSLSGHVTYNSKPQIKLGFNRVFFSGNFNNLSDETVSTEKWSIRDAANLVFEPLFNRNKTGLSYTTLELQVLMNGIKSLMAT